MFAEFPGVGGRQAKRFAYHILSRNAVFAEALSSLILETRRNAARCDFCCRFFKKPSTQGNFCDICSSPDTDKETLMLLEKDMDLENVRKTGAYKGLYFVMGGLLPILEENPAQKIRIRELVKTVEKAAKDGLKEIIIAFSVSPEGENTALYVSKTLEPLSKNSGFKISVLGRGLSTGTELEYSDSETIQSALRNRK